MKRGLSSTHKFTFHLVHLIIVTQIMATSSRNQFYAYAHHKVVPRLPTPRWVVRNPHIKKRIVAVGKIHMRHPHYKTVRLLTLRNGYSAIINKLVSKGANLLWVDMLPKIYFHPNDSTFLFNFHWKSQLNSWQAFKPLCSRQSTRCYQ